MDQRLHFITFATEDLDRAREFYKDALGWDPLLDVPGEIIFFQVAPGLVLGLFDSAKFSQDLGIAGTTAGVSGVTLSPPTTQHIVVGTGVTLTARSLPRERGTS